MSNARYDPFMVSVSTQHLRILLASLVLCVMLAACGGDPPQVTESDPFAAAVHRVQVQRWHTLLREGEHLLTTAAVPPSKIEDLANRLRTERDRAMGEGGAKIPLEIRRRSAQLIANLEYMNRMSASPAQASLRGSPSSRTQPVIFDWPVDAPRITSGFGLRPDPFTPGLRSFHNGIDFAAPEGTVVRPAAIGQVVEAGFRNDGCGLAVTIVHPDGFASDYCHLAEVKVQSGQQVTRQDILGYIGTTGRSTGAHLHWSVWKLGAAIDPRRVIGRRNGSAH